MKEIKDIVRAFHAAHQAGKRAVLATVVHVEGSSYRRPGARMLVTEDGQITGAISGGCLEGDALRKALLTIERGEARIAVYDTTDEDDLAFGIQLGCNGVVHILFEPIDPALPHYPIALLENILSVREDAILVTLFSLQPFSPTQPGTCLLYREDDAAQLPSPVSLSILSKDARNVLAQQESSFVEYETVEGKLTGFIELIKPPVSLVIVGAGNDAIPLTEIAQTLGWEITVIDRRATHATVSRFPHAQNLIVAKPEMALQSIVPYARTAILLMTHNYGYDLAALAQALKVECFYIGVLGPKEKLGRMLLDLDRLPGSFDQKQLAKLHGPTGLDIGAETAEEIAVSIIAEIGAVLNGRLGSSLRHQDHPIHRRALRHAG